MDQGRWGKEKRHACFEHAYFNIASIPGPAQWCRGSLGETLLQALASLGQVLLLQRPPQGPPWYRGDLCAGRGGLRLTRRRRSRRLWLGRVGGGGFRFGRIGGGRLRLRGVGRRWLAGLRLRGGALRLGRHFAPLRALRLCRRRRGARRLLLSGRGRQEGERHGKRIFLKREIEQNRVHSNEALGKLFTAP